MIMGCIGHENLLACLHVDEGGEARGDVGPKQRGEDRPSIQTLERSTAPGLVNQNNHLVKVFAEGVLFD